MHVLVTCGGTAEPIDDVRYVTNFATGRFGLALAAAVPAGAQVEAACSSLAAAHAQNGPAVATSRFVTVDDLADTYATHAAASSDAEGAVVFAAAAVSDYRPVAMPGKIRSDAETMTLQLRRTPKLIDGLRELYGRQAYLVGFKLLVGAEPAELHQAALDLLRRARLDLVVANDLDECRDGQHPAWLVTAEGGAIRVTGTRDEVAHHIWRFVQQRRNVTWSTTELAGPDGPKADEDTLGWWDDARRFAQDTGMLFDPSGNVVAADREPGRLVISPRGVAKHQLVRADAVTVEVTGRTIRCGGDAKSSIDTAPSYRTLAATRADILIHFHRPWGRFDATTLFPLPCGAAEEADLVLEALGSVGATSRARWLVELVHHGALLGIAHGELGQLRAEWGTVRAAWQDHLGDVTGQIPAGLLDEALVQPVWDGPRIVGIVATFAGPEAAVYLTDAVRGRGIGDAVAGQLARRYIPIVTADACDVAEYWRSRGFAIERGKDGLLRGAAPWPEGTDPVVGGLDRRAPSWQGDTGWRHTQQEVVDG